MVVSVALVGAGNMAREHILAFGALEGVSVSGIHSRTKAKAEALAKEFRISVVADSIHDLFNRTRADIVVVTVPELALNAVAKLCFCEDWAVLLEKPAGYDLEDALDIAAAAKATNHPVMVGLNRRFYSSALAVIGDLNGRGDERRFIHVQDQQSFDEARFHNHPEEVVHRFMYANSIHVIDLLRFFARGDVSQITPIFPWQGEKTEVVVCGVKFDSGDTALYEGIWKGPGPWACSVSTPSKRWTMQPVEDALYQDLGQRRQVSVDRSDDDVAFKPGLRLQAQAAIDRVMGKQSDIVSLQESLQTMRLINQIFGV